MRAGPLAATAQTNRFCQSHHLSRLLLALNTRQCKSNPSPCGFSKVSLSGGGRKENKDQGDLIPSIFGTMKAGVFSINAQLRFVSVIVNAVLGPPSLMRHT